MSKTAARAKPNSAQSAMRSGASVSQPRNTLAAHVCVQRDATRPNVHPHAPALVRETLETPGQALDGITRSGMEANLGHDFSQVRVHTDERASESAHAVGARAYTTGTHVAFASGQYAPGNSSGQHLIAHELTHVVQQAFGPVESTNIAEGLSVSQPGDRFEREARESAKFSSSTPANDNTVVGAAPAPLPSRGAHPANPVIQRADTDLSSAESHTVATSSVIGGIGGGASALFAGVGLIPAFMSAAAARRQADIAGEQLEEGRVQNRIARDALGVSERQAEAAETPPVPVPTTGGIVINNGSGHSDIPDSAGKASPSTRARAGELAESRLQILRISQGAENFATFMATVRHDGKDIQGGNFEDGESRGYLGGSDGANLSLTLRATNAAPVPGARPRSPIGSIRILASGTNAAPRTVDGRRRPNYQLQRFSGNIAVNAAGAVSAPPFSASPGGPVSPTGNGTSGPLININLEDTSGAPAPIVRDREAEGRGRLRAGAGGSTP